VESLKAGIEAFFAEVLIDIEKEFGEGSSCGDSLKDPNWIAKELLRLRRRYIITPCRIN
jgi:hypothetical protein